MLGNCFQTPMKRLVT